MKRLTLLLALLLMPLFTGCLSKIQHVRDCQISSRHKWGSDLKACLNVGPLRKRLICYGSFTAEHLSRKRNCRRMNPPALKPVGKSRKQ